MGRRVTAFTADELADENKPAILRPYLECWKWEVGQFFGGRGHDASEAEPLRIGPDHPVFRIGAATRHGE